jgi:hypothetical protein
LLSVLRRMSPGALAWSCRRSVQRAARPTHLAALNRCAMQRRCVKKGNTKLYEVAFRWSANSRFPVSSSEQLVHVENRKNSKRCALAKCDGLRKTWHNLKKAHRVAGSSFPIARLTLPGSSDAPRRLPVRLLAWLPVQVPSNSPESPLVTALRHLSQCRGCCSRRRRIR